ncbi:hypothetical protein [Nodosilinea sp. E11]|uniref:hypothetical protein n=1 Tax=Nodosilinea sp. E11 TaxID=3037479 RepID=UPI00293476E1|nr:hypothetical protein [Nodosilinea sp. E11]WOD37389.1 hypothetical protein RRF56_02605 [Nodosilinea sp. E11]WOD37951.1 hypothetical protein RRF56_17195 [Nodosilinea sp. E11]
MTEKTKAGRPAKWSGPTRAIRVPEALADHLLEIARQLDNPQPDNVQNPTGLPICKPAADAATIAQGLAEGWIAPKPLPQTQMLTSESSSGTYRLFLEPPRELPPQMAASIDEYCDRLLAGLTQSEQAALLCRLVDEMGEKIDG